MAQLTVLDFIDKATPDYVKTISQYKWELIPESQMQAAKIALSKSDYIKKVACGAPESVYNAIMQAGILGVDLTEGKRQAYLLPRKVNKETVIVLQVGYKGVEAIHQRMGVIDRLSVNIVHENDRFEWSGDDAEKPTHNADWFSKDRGEITGAYAVTYYPNGTHQTVVAPITTIHEKHRDVSDSWKDYIKKKQAGEWAFPPPWETYPEEMIKKTMAYIASKQWPANYRNQEASSRILETLHEIDYADYQSLRDGFTAEQKKAFDELLETDDALGLSLFSRYVGNQIYIALFNSFPKGEITALKKKCRELESTGIKVLNAITEAVEAEDQDRFHENIEDCSDTTINLLKRVLDEKGLEMLGTVKQLMKGE